MNPLIGRAIIKTSALCVIMAAACAATAHAATKLRLDRAVLDFDPNQSIWHVSSQLCNKDQAPSGSLNYHIWFYVDDSSTRSGKSHFHNLGGVKFNKQLAPGECWNYADTRITVNLKNLPPGQYHIELVIGEWSGSKFVPVISQPFYLENGLFQDFIKG